MGKTKADREWRQKVRADTLEFATNFNAPYSDDDLDHIRQLTGNETTVELALDIGRTYDGIHYAAEKHHIPLLVPGHDSKGRRLGLYCGHTYTLMTLAEACRGKQQDQTIMGIGTLYMLVSNGVMRKIGQSQQKENARRRRQHAEASRSV